MLRSRSPRYAAALVLAASSAASAQQQVAFDDVVRNLHSQDPKTRAASVQLLRDARYPEAIAPLALLVVDPVDDVQLEAIAAEVSFFFDQDPKTKKKVTFVTDKKGSEITPVAFDLGPLAVVPHAAPQVLLDSLLQAIDDETPKVRTEAIYAFGIVATAPLNGEQQARLVKALDNFDPAVRDGAARVIARLKVDGTGDALLKAVNDTQPEVRFAAMRALGAIRDQRAIGALTEQLAYYKKGEGAWSALDGLAHIASPASVPAFKERLQDKDPYLRRVAIEGLARTGDTSALDAIERLATDDSPMVRAAAVFALQKLRRDNGGRLIDLMSTGKLIPQIQEYLIELGPPDISVILPHIQEGDPDLRQALVEVLGVIGDASVVAVLEVVANGDHDESVAAAAKRSLARLTSR